MRAEKPIKASDTTLAEKWFIDRPWADRIQKAFDRGEACQHKLETYHLHFSDMNDGRVNVGSAELEWCPTCGGTKGSEALKTLKQILETFVERNVSDVDVRNSAYCFCEVLAGAAAANLTIFGSDVGENGHFLPRLETKGNPEVVTTGWFCMALESEADILCKEKEAWEEAKEMEKDRVS